VTRDIELNLISSQPALRHEPRGRIVAVEKAVMARNDELAANNRERFRQLGVLVINVMSSPGSGKTEFLVRTLKHFADRTNAAVIVGDLSTDRDAQRLAATGADAMQIQTGNICHLEADMIDRAGQVLDLVGRDVLIIENVGNLVCPAGYDLGENLRVVLLSTTEGEDKPLKYPRAFRRADIVIINKIDLSEAAGFDRSLALEHLRAIAPQARVFEVSARTGQGMEAWFDELEHHLERIRATRAEHRLA
jgi:hydrogenase nickel incorporation protein HypB